MPERTEKKTYVTLENNSWLQMNNNNNNYNSKENTRTIKQFIYV